MLRNKQFYAPTQEVGIGGFLFYERM